MLAISVEFLHGTYRGDPDGGAVSGRASLGEWPPSVARLLAAFVAADGMGEGCRVTTGIELEFLESLGPPVIHAEPDPLHQPLHPRYVVLASKSPAKATHQEYPARTGALVRPGARVALRHAQVVYVWEDADAANSLDALRLRAARIGYLGCADSPVRVRVTSDIEASDIEEAAAKELHAFRPRAAGTRMVSVPRPGHHLAALAAAYGAWQEHGPSAARSQFPALRNLVAYAGPEDVTDEEEAGHVVAWLRLKQSVSGRRIGDVTAALKGAVISKYERLYGDPVPRELHGHGFEGTGFEIARYLALPNAGFDHSDGRIHGAAIWLPHGNCDEIATERIRAAARSVDVLHTSNISVGVAPWAGEARPKAVTPARWRERSDAWVTAVPAIHERFGKLDLPELRRWCRHARLPEPIAFRSARVPLVKGALALHPIEVHRPAPQALDAMKPYSHVELRFAEAVRGPVVIGGGRSRGFGLCVPIEYPSEPPVKAEQGSSHV